MLKMLAEIENELNDINNKLEELKKNTKRKRPDIGSEIEAAGIKWTILDKTETGFFTLASKSVGDYQFGSDNNWVNSEIRENLKTIQNDIESEIGCELPVFERDLLSLDGQVEYGKCMDKVSLISLDEYRKYRMLIPNAGYYWWTLTPDSTKCNDDSRWIRVVSPSGDFNYCYYHCNYGVRPVCIFPSEIFESGDE